MRMVGVLGLLLLAQVGWAKEGCEFLSLSTPPLLNITITKPDEANEILWMLGMMGMMSEDIQKDPRLFDCYRTLLKKGADPNLTNPMTAQRPLEAVGTINPRHNDIIKLLLEAGANPTALDNSGKMSLMPWIVHHGNVENIKLAQKKGGRLSEAPPPKLPFNAYLNMAVRSGSLETLKYLIEQGLKLEDKAGYDDATALHVAVSSGHANIVKFLLGQGSDLNKKNSLENTPLILASELPSSEIALLLLKRGAKFTVNYYGYTPLSGALRNKYSDSALIKLLKDQETDMKRTLKNGDSYLHSAASAQKDPTLLKEILNVVQNVSQKNDSGITPLGSAVMGRNTAAAKFLIEQGAVVNEPATMSGGSYLGIAAKLGDLEMVKLLLSKGALPEPLKEDPERLAPQHVVADGYFKEEHVEVLDYLFNNGADFDAKDSKGRTALDIAESIQSDSLVSIYLRKNKERFRFKKMKAEWDAWIRNPASLPEDRQQNIIRAMIHLQNTGSMPNQLPKQASAAIKHAYENIKIAKGAPWTLTEKTLELDDMPIEYYSAILRAARTPEARTANKFHPTPEQAKKTLKLGVVDEKSGAVDFEMMSWLIAKSKMDLDVDALAHFKFDEEGLRADVAKMLETDALRYRGNSTLAAIKLIKALESHGDINFECRDGQMANPQVSDILIWFGAYGNNADADRQFFAKLARYILARKPVCAQYRNILLRAMNQWKAANAPVQGEIVCAIDKAFHEMPVTFSDTLILAQAVGMKSELSQGAWLEQLAAYASVRAANKDKPATETEAEIGRGLLKAVLGSPEGKLKFGDTAIVVNKAESNKGFVERACRVARDKAELVSWMAEVREGLGAARPWPKGFEIETPAAATLEEEFVAAGLEKDLEAIKTGCGSVVVEEKKTSAPKPAVKSSAPAVKPKRSGDFDPRPRSQRK